MMIDQLNNHENSLIKDFKSHLFFKQIDKISWPSLLEALIQRRFLSLSIVGVYEFIIDALDDSQAKKTVRGILNEEYPRNTEGVPLPSHRELLFKDLLHLGATSEMILSASETTETQHVRDESYRLMKSCLGQRYCQIGLIAFLRFWAEVLVSVEYTCLWKRISERLSNQQSTSKVRSEFYYFHMIHDSKHSDVGEESILGGLTHSQELAVHLQRLLVPIDDVQYCLDLEYKIFLLKSQFYDQFL